MTPRARSATCIRCVRAAAIVGMMVATIAARPALAAGDPPTAPPGAPGFGGVGVFEMPRLTRLLREAAALDDGEAAAARLRADTAAHPHAAALQLRLAAAEAAAGRMDAAIAALRLAVTAGVPPSSVLRQPAFAALRDDPRLEALVPGAPSPVATAAPAVARAGVAPVGEGNTSWNAALGALEVAIAFPPEPWSAAPFALTDDGVSRRLAALVARGEAAGNHGDVYDNRDRGHARPDPAAFPQLAFTRYDEAALAARADYGLNEALLFDAVVFGNSSTALRSGPFWRSLPRLALTRPEGPTLLYRQYAANHLYVYPEHFDHDPERGDLLPANTPYILISQGSSRSDMPFLRAIATILAALRPEVKAFLRETGLIAPTVQMILRQGMANIRTRADYLGPLAHPTAFDAAGVNLARMVAIANGLRRESVPPMARIRVAEEPPSPKPGLGVFGEGLEEVFFDTPAAAARIAYGLAYDRRYVLDAGATADPNDRPLRFEWRVLRGEGVKLRRLDDEGRRAEVVIPWQEPSPAPGPRGLRSARVDIAVFADNGAVLSAPAFFSVVFPPNQSRDYDAEGRLLSLGPRQRAEDGYADPLLFPAIDWRDAFCHGADGVLLGWRRARNGATALFDASGVMLEGPDAAAAGGPVAIRYPVIGRREGASRIAPEPGGRARAGPAPACPD